MLEWVIGRGVRRACKGQTGLFYSMVVTCSLSTRSIHILWRNIAKDLIGLHLTCEVIFSSTCKGSTRNMVRLSTAKATTSHRR